MTCLFNLLLRYSWVAALICLLVACSPKPKASIDEVTGTQAERVKIVSQIIRNQATLPSPLLDAHFLQQKDGDGTLGPSDITSFYALTIAPAELATWKAVMSPISSTNSSVKFVAPPKSISWWLTPSEFPNLEFYDPKSLTGRSNGWIGIVPQSGKIFIYTFSM